MSGQANLKALWPLLLENPHELYDAQIARLLEAKEELSQLVHLICHIFFSDLEAIQRYRQKKAEWIELPLATLMEMAEKAEKEDIARIVQLGNAFHGTMPIDSDLHVLCEILREKPWDDSVSIKVVAAVPLINQID